MTTHILTHGIRGHVALTKQANAAARRMMQLIGGKAQLRQAPASMAARLFRDPRSARDFMEKFYPMAEHGGSDINLANIRKFLADTMPTTSGIGQFPGNAALWPSTDNWMGDVSDKITRFLGSPSVATRTPHGLDFRINSGPTVRAVGGWSGGIGRGSIPTGNIFPRMASGGGVDPLGSSNWYNILKDVPGWFPK